MSSENILFIIICFLAILLMCMSVVLHNCELNNERLSDALHQAIDNEFKMLETNKKLLAELKKRYKEG